MESNTNTQARSHADSAAAIQQTKQGGAAVGAFSGDKTQPSSVPPHEAVVAAVPAARVARDTQGAFVAHAESDVRAELDTLAESATSELISPLVASVAAQSVASPAPREGQLSCDVCRDLMPLVSDGVASDDSAALVAAHTAT